MGYSIMKHWKVNQSGYPKIESPEVSCYLYDKFYRFKMVIPATDIVKYLINQSSDTYNVYLTHNLSDGKTRTLDNITVIQSVSFYYRPMTENVKFLKRLVGSPYVLLAGITSGGGMRVVVRCATKQEFYNAEIKYGYCYKQVLLMLKEKFNSPIPKSTSTDILGCISVLSAEGFYINENPMIFYC